jgi:restriction system protein
LVELGGEANLNLVLESVYESMKHRLNEYDLACLASDETAPRWRNAAQWERSLMREEGLIRGDTPRGTWSLSDEGRRWLEKVQRRE